MSKMNALKHGILALEVVVQGRNYREDRRGFEELRARFHRELQPVGPVEEMLVDQIVTCQWRWRRVLRAESGAIVLSVDEGQWRRTQMPHPEVLWMGWEGAGDPVPAMQNTAVGNAILEMLLGELRTAVEQEGELTEAMLQWLLGRFRGKPNCLTNALAGLREGGGQNREVLVYLDQQLRAIAAWKAECAEREAGLEAARQAAAVLPGEREMEKILRYETKLERSRFRAMVQLERLQRMRRGEEVAAPACVEVGDRD